MSESLCDHVSCILLSVAFSACCTDDDIALNMSSSTSDLSLFSSFEKESTEHQTSLGLHAVASNSSAVADDAAMPRAGSGILIEILSNELSASIGSFLFDICNLCTMFK